MSRTPPIRAKVVDINSQTTFSTSCNGGPRLYKISSCARFDSVARNRLRKKGLQTTQYKNKQQRIDEKFGRQDWNRFDYGLGYKPDEHFISKKQKKLKYGYGRPKSNLGGCSKKYWERRKGKPYRKVLREGLSKGLSTSVQRPKQPELDNPWQAPPIHTQLFSNPIPQNRKNGSCAWRNSASRLNTAHSTATLQCENSVWNKITNNAVLHDRPASRGFTPGKLNLVRCRSAPELKQRRIIETNIKNYDYFLKMPVRNGHMDC